MSAPVNRAMRTRANAPASTAPAAPAAKSTTRAPVAQVPAKSIRQLNKENEDLQIKVEDLTNSLQAANAGKQAFKAAFEKSSKEKDELIEQLRTEMDELQEDSQLQLASRTAALQKATDEARDKAALAEEAEAALQKLSQRAKEYQTCLESVGVNAVSLKEWTQRDLEKQQDVIMLEEQIQKAMDELKDTRKALQEDVQREEDFSKSIAEFRTQLRVAKEASDQDPVSDGDDTASEAGEDEAPALSSTPETNDAEELAAMDGENWDEQLGDESKFDRDDKSEQQVEDKSEQQVAGGDDQVLMDDSGPVPQVNADVVAAPSSIETASPTMEDVSGDEERAVEMEDVPAEAGSYHDEADLDNSRSTECESVAHDGKTAAGEPLREEEVNVVDVAHKDITAEIEPDQVQVCEIGPDPVEVSAELAFDEAAAQEQEDDAALQNNLDVEENVDTGAPATSDDLSMLAAEAASEMQGGELDNTQVSAENSASFAALLMPADAAEEDEEDGASAEGPHVTGEEDAATDAVADDGDELDAAASSGSTRRLSVPHLLNPDESAPASQNLEPATCGEDPEQGAQQGSEERATNKRLSSALTDLLNPEPGGDVLREDAPERPVVFDKAVC